MYPFRKELVGKRFMCVRWTNNSRPNSRSNRSSNPLDYPWKCGIIRACTEEDCDNPEQKVLVEFDNEDWSSREWIPIYKQSWKLFLVEKNMVWAQRPDPSSPKRPILWPALTFYALVDKHGLEESQSIGVEFLGDHFRSFCTASEMRPYQEDDGLQPALRNNTKVVEELLNWQTLQKSQGILIHGPFTLTGFRVQVYREKCRQWYSAVITSHDLISREMDVMDDTVLQTHRVNPRLIMVLLLANEVELDSMLRGDLVRVLPVRPNRQSQVVITSSLTPENNSSGNSMWRFLNDMWSDPKKPQQGQSTIYTSSPLNQTMLTTTASTTCSSATQRRRKSDGSRQSKKKGNSGSEQSQSSIEQPSDSRFPSSHSSSPKSHSTLHRIHTPSPVKAGYGQPLSRSSISSPVRFSSHYSSMENLSHPNSSPGQHMAPQRPSSASALNVSAQRLYTSPQKTPPLSGLTSSPVDNHQRSPPPIMDPKHGFLGASNHSLSPSRQYTPPKSSPSFSPFRSTKLSPVFGGSSLGGQGSSAHALSGSRMSSSQPSMGSVGHCRDPAAHLLGGCGCTSKHSHNQSLLEKQLYALQVQHHQQLQQHQQQQQQLKQHQSLSECQMHINQLQLMAGQLKAAQKGTLTTEQTQILSLYYKQIIQRYQEDNMLDYHTSTQDLPLLSNQLQMQMHLKYLEEQEKQKYLRQPYLPTFEPENLQTCLSHLPESTANGEHLQRLLAQQQGPELTKKQEKDTVKDHVARLKRFIPSCQQQDKEGQSTVTSSQASTSRSNPESTEAATPLKSSLIKSSPTSHPLPSELCCTQADIPLPQMLPSEKEDNKTDDQKVVAAMKKPSFSEKQQLSANYSTEPPINSEPTKGHVKKTQRQHRQNSQERRQAQNKTSQKTSNDDDPFGFDEIKDDDPFGFNIIKDVQTADKQSLASVDMKDTVPQATEHKTNFEETPHSEVIPDSVAKKIDSDISTPPNSTQEPTPNIDIPQKTVTEKSNVLTTLRSVVNKEAEKVPKQETPTANDSSVGKIPKRKEGKTEGKKGKKEGKKEGKQEGKKEGLTLDKKSKSKQLTKKDNKSSSTPQEKALTSALVVQEDTTTADKKTTPKLTKSQNKQSKKDKKKTPPQPLIQQQDSLDTNINRTTKESSPNRASVIMYIDNKISSTVSNTSTTDKQCREQTVVSPVESEMISVKKLLEFHKTSAQLAVKVFQEQNMMLDAQTIPATPTESCEVGKANTVKKQSKKRKSSVKDTFQTQHDVLGNKTQQFQQSTSTQNLLSETCSEGSQNKQTIVKSGLYFNADRNQFVGQNNKFFPDLTVQTPKGHVLKQQKEIKISSNSETVEKHESDNTKSSKEHRGHDWRMSRENKNSKTSSPSEPKNNFPVNFIADQTIQNLTTVSRVMEPIAVSALLGTEYTVKQIKRQDSEDDSSCAQEQRRKRKKTLKVLENESEEDNGKGIAKSKNDKELKKSRKVKTQKGDSIVDTRKEENNGDVKSDKETKYLEVKLDFTGKKKDTEKPLGCESKEFIEMQSSTQQDDVDVQMKVPKQPSQDPVVSADPKQETKKKQKKDPNEKKKRSKPKDKEQENALETEKKKKKRKKTIKEEPNESPTEAKDNKLAKPLESTVVLTKDVNMEFSERISDVKMTQEGTLQPSEVVPVVGGGIGGVLNTVTDQVMQKEGQPQETGKEPTDEKPIKEIIDKLAAKKKSEKTNKRKKKIQESEDSPVKVKRRKRREPIEEFFVQNGGCSMFPNLPKCRDCREEEDNSSSIPSQNCCRFTLFRRLKKKIRSGKVQIAGFLVPENAEKEDLEPWLAKDDVINVVSRESALYILKYTADEFCSLVQEEKEAQTSRGDSAVISYKRAVVGLREMCDACATTIFNIHWVCQRCGFGVCLDCYDLRVKEKTNTQTCGKKVFEFKWVHCTPGLCHQPKNLTIAQIIPKEVLNDLSGHLHEIRTRWNIGEKCPCQDKDNTLKITEITKNEPLTNSNPKSTQQMASHITVDAENKEAVIKPAVIKPENSEAKPVVKKTLMEKVRERLKERIEAQKSESSGAFVNKQHIIKSSNQQPLKHRAHQNNTTAILQPLKVSSSPVKQPVLSSDSLELSTDKKMAEQVSDTAASNVKQPGQVKMSSGLSLLMNYDSSSEDSPDVSPRKCSNSTGNAFDFNLGLLALVASKSTGIIDKQGPKDLKDQGNMKSNVNCKQETGCKTVTLTKREADGEKLLNWFTTAEQEQAVKAAHQHTALETATLGESTSCVTMETSSLRNQTHPMEPPSSLIDPEGPISNDEYPAPHSFMCNGRLLRLHEPHHPGNSVAFAKRWLEGKPILISNIDKLLDSDLWSPESFEKEFGDEIADVVNCRTGKTVENFNVGAFWKGFESVKDRALDINGEPMLLKLKDWPPGDDFSEKLTSRFNNLMEHIPLPEYTRRDGLRNLVARLPDFFVKPDLGPKMYNAYGSAAFPNEGTTNLHIDMSDAVNIMVYVGVPKDEGAGEKERTAAIKAVDVACDEIQQQRVRKATPRIGALWHIFEVNDADKIREFLLEVAKERKMKYSTHHDPIHDQCFYLDGELRGRLKREHNVEGYAICQCLGDGVFIPAGAPHQVRNLYSCVKVAEDFVSPERIGQCFKTTQEFRHLSDKHTNHEDKLQIKNIIYHAVKDAVHVLKYHDSKNLGNQTNHQKNP